MSPLAKQLDACLGLTLQEGRARADLLVRISNLRIEVFRRSQEVQHLAAEKTRLYGEYVRHDGLLTVAIQLREQAIDALGAAERQAAREEALQG